MNVLRSLPKLSNSSLRHFTKPAISGLKSPVELSSFINRDVMPKMYSNFSTLADKERSEESRYIKQVESKRQAELKAKLEAILSLETSNKQRADVIDLLEGKNEENKGFLARWNLNNKVMGIPIAIFFIFPCFEKGYIALNEDTVVFIAFMMWFGITYTQFGPAISRHLEGEIEKERTLLKNFDDGLKENLVNEAKIVGELVGLDKTFASTHEFIDNLSVVHSQALTASAEQQYRDAIAKKLDSLLALENSAATALRQRALREVKASVLDAFKNDKKVKEAALNQALAVLAGGANSKLGKDVVGETFASAIKTYRENYLKQPPGSDKIIQTLEDEIAALIQEPVISAKGGNVYETHPVSKLV